MIDKRAYLSFRRRTHTNSYPTFGGAIQSHTPRSFTPPFGYPLNTPNDGALFAAALYARASLGSQYPLYKQAIDYFNSFTVGGSIPDKLVGINRME